MMKKSITSLVVAGAFAGLAGSASAALNLQNDGIGHILIVPYFTTQNGNSTLLNLVNTDTVNGKAVKVRFRGGKDSDDIYDFQVFMSPGDVWTANVSQSASGASQLTTSDLTCTLPVPATLNTTMFQTGRLSTADATSGVGTREGYVEIFNMADLPATSPLYTVTKHPSAGTAPTCGSTLEAITTAYPTLNAAVAHPTGPAGSPTIYTAATGTVVGLRSPTSGLMANWTIINVPNTTVFTGVATAIEATGTTRIVYSPQTSTGVTNPQVLVTDYPDVRSTFDGVLLTNGFSTARYDFPDMSTPYENVAGGLDSAAAQIYELSAAIAHTNLVNEYIVETGISGKTDWLVSMPTRRYFVAGRGKAGVTDTNPLSAYANTSQYVVQAETTAAQDTCFDETDIANQAGTAYSAGGTYGRCGLTAAAGAGTLLDVLVATGKGGAQGYFRSVTNYAPDGRSACVSIGGYTVYGREEQTTTGSSVVVSPGTVTQVQLCGEVNILSLNNLTGNTGAVGANLTVAGLNPGYSNGWAQVNLNATGKKGGLPVIGYAFVKAVNPAVSAGVSGNFGGAWAHRWVSGAK